MKLVTSKTGWAEIFRNTPESERVTFRTWESWRANEEFPSVKVGGRVFLDLDKVRAVFNGEAPQEQPLETETTN